jgi:Na+/melibiose symporter-like transporter
VFAVAQVLQVAGYVPPLEQAGQLVEQPQSETFILALRMAFVLLPVAMIAFGIFFAARFPLTGELYARLGRELNARRAGLPGDEQEAQALKKRLIG